MNPERVKALLRELREELEGQEDASRLDTLRAFDDDLHRLLEARQGESEAAADDEPQGMLERARELEATFASRHPLAERLLRELVDTLSRMGV